ncbi:condensation domain-containing protein [Kitasatospora sp. NBC_01266]|uniref:condensation domain-containing protein n=1 Tax=Kitasatospora sp. NBC_01266 TaxID=2903572 RepID=UPI002E305240|nr:condensation domain-containing protein [Kitasatospora sp. NBC_01266]
MTGRAVTGHAAAEDAVPDGWERLVTLLDEREIVLRTTGDRLGYLAPPGAVDAELTGLVRAHRDRLLSTLTGAGAAVGAAVAAAPAGVAQRQMHRRHGLAVDPAVWNITQRIALRGPLVPGRLAEALTALTARHESLRTRYRATELGLLQQVQPNRPVELPFEDLRGTAPESRAAAVAEAARVEVGRPFDLATAPLLRARLLRLADQEWVLLLTFHHIAIDGWSLATVLADLGALYGPDGYPSERDPGRMTDHACWERTVVTREAVRAATAHWADTLDGLPLTVELPTDRTRPEQRSGHGGTAGFRLPAALTEAVGRYAAARSTTPSAVLLAALAELIGSLTGAPETLVLLSNANRTRPADEQVVGLLTNSLPIRLRTAAPDGFGALVDRAATAVATALDHAAVPFGLLVEPLRERGLPFPAAFPQVQLTIQSTPPALLALPDLTAEVTDVPGPSARADLLLILTPDPDGLQGLAEYDADLFDPATVRSWLALLVGNLTRQLDLPLQRRGPGR